MAFFLGGCAKDMDLGSQSYPLGLEKHSLLLKNDGTPDEVGVKDGGWSISGIVADGEIHENSTYLLNDDKHREVLTYRDTMIFDWIEIYRINEGHTLKVKPQPNTTGSARSIEIGFFAPYRHDCDLVITQSE
jgi:hypothetical protein